MPANVYECMFLLDATKVQGDVPAAAQQLHSLFEKHDAEVLASRPWSEGRLAYPINKQKKGLYYLTYFRSEGKNIVNIENDCKLNDMIMRMLVLKIDPKLVEPMLEMARDEHALALQTVKQETDDDDRMDRMDGGMNGPRRGPRGGH